MRTQRNRVNGGRGFTLVELLTVVAIIGLLVGMVVPTIKAVLENKARMQMQVRIRSLDDGCNIYKLNFTGNKYFPGQDPEGISALQAGSASAKYPSCINAGSALLARCLFTDPNGLFPTSNYGQYENGMLDTAQSPATGVPRSIIDNGSDVMAILYYPSRLDKRGSVDQFQASDNSKYTAPSGVTAPVAKDSGGTAYTIQTYVKPSTTSSNTTPIRQDGLFILTAAGTTDRLYFSTNSVDNFTK